LHLANLRREILWINNLPRNIIGGAGKEKQLYLVYSGDIDRQTKGEKAN